MAIYGIRELNLLFFVALETNAEGFIFKRKQYTWADIKYVDVGQEGPYGSQSPYCRVTLTNGVSIRFGGRTFAPLRTRIDVILAIARAEPSRPSRCR